MKIMLYEWHGFMQKDIEETLDIMHIEYRVFLYSFLSPDIMEDSYFEKYFIQIIRDGGYDGVLSLNFWPVVANCCYKLGIPYMAWVYDSPVIIDGWERALLYPTNYCFVFDLEDYNKLKKRGFPVYHMLLASNLNRLDRLEFHDRDMNRYQSDIAFVGRLYQTGYSGFCAGLDEFVRGCLDSVVETQLKIYGTTYFDQLFDENMISILLEQLKYKYGTDYGKSAREHLYMLLFKEITCRERTTLLYLLSQYNNVALYSDRENAILDKVSFRGMVDSYEEIHKVFRNSKINLNITYKGITKGIPLRAMEIMGAGGFLLSNYQEELVENFRPGVECAVYESMEDAVEQVKYYLAHEEERKLVAHNGHEAMKRFTYVCQLNKIFDTVFKDFPEK